MDHSTALVLFSGGQDSATCLAWALANHHHVETVGFDYGQRHAIELECRCRVITALRANFPGWARRLGEDHTIDLQSLGQLADTALTRDMEIKYTENQLPNTFVPGRNIIFLSMAAALAYRRGIATLVGGMCETDYSGYPDCRDDAIKSLQRSLNIGMETNIRIETPLMWLNKAQTWKMAENLGGPEFVELVRKETHSCYMGVRTMLHVWGYGCGACPACTLRERGYLSYLDVAQTVS